MKNEKIACSNTTIGMKFESFLPKVVTESPMLFKGIFEILLFGPCLTMLPVIEQTKVHRNPSRSIFSTKFPSQVSAT